MRDFKFFSKEKINQSYPIGILNGYYNHNMPYSDLRPYYCSRCNVDIFSEVNATTYDDLMVIDNWVNVEILSVIIDGVVYSSEGVGIEWEFPNNWESDKKYIYEYMLITYPMIDNMDISEDSWNEVVNEINSPEVPELPQRDDNSLEPRPEDRGDGSVFIDMSDRIKMLEDIIRYNV